MTLWTLAPVLLEQVRNYCRHPRYVMHFSISNGPDVDNIYVSVRDTKTESCSTRLLIPYDVGGKTSEESFALELALQIKRELKNGG